MNRKGIIGFLHLGFQEGKAFLCDVQHCQKKNSWIYPLIFSQQKCLLATALPQPIHLGRDVHTYYQYLLTSHSFFTFLLYDIYFYYSETLFHPIPIIFLLYKSVDNFQSWVYLTSKKLLYLWDSFLRVSCYCPLVDFLPLF